MAYFKNTDTLHYEIERLKAECSSLEQELDRRRDHLQNNYIPMLANSAVYGFIKSPQSFTVAKDMLKGMWNAESIKNFLKNTGKKLLQAIAVRLGFKIVNDFAKGQSGENAAAG